MRSIVVAAALITSLALAPAARAGNGPKGPGAALAPLAAFGERMEKIVDAVIAGRDPKAAAGDWKLEIDPDLAKELKAAGATTARLTGYELDLLLGSGKQEQRVSTIVHATPRTTALLMLSASERGSKDMTPIDKLTRTQQPFGDAARALLAASKGKGGCARLPMAGEKLLAEIAPGPIGEELKKESATRDRACATLERGDAPVSIRVDDTLILVLDRSGKPLGGVRSHLELVDGGIRLGLRRFKAL